MVDPNFHLSLVHLASQDSFPCTSVIKSYSISLVTYTLFWVDSIISDRGIVLSSNIFSNDGFNV